MSRRPRKHIPIIELLASALADKLPQKERDTYRALLLPASAIVHMFTPDHIQLHSWGGSDKWWNLDMRRRGPELAAKDRADTSRAAKAVRLDQARWKAFVGKLNKPKPRRPKRSRWPSRPFGR